MSTASANSVMKKIKPKNSGDKVFSPATKLHIQDSGTYVAWNKYWMRRLANNEIEIMPEVEVKKEKESKK